MQQLWFHLYLIFHTSIFTDFTNIFLRFSSNLLAFSFKFNISYFTATLLYKFIFLFFYSKGLSTFNMFCRISTYFVFSVIFLSFLILLLMSIFSFNLYSIFIHYFFLIHFPNVCFLYIACNQHKYLIPILFVKILWKLCTLIRVQYLTLFIVIFI